MTTKQNVNDFGEPVNSAGSLTAADIRKSYVGLVKVGERGRKSIKKVDAMKPLDPPPAFLPEVSILLNILELLDPLDYNTSARIVNFVAQRLQATPEKSKTVA